MRFSYVNFNEVSVFADFISFSLNKYGLYVEIFGYEIGVEW